MPFPGNHILIYGTKGKIESFGGVGEKSINKIIITTNGGEKIFEYPQTHLYGAEVENFIKYYFLNDKNVNKGTTLDEALLSLRIIDLLRKSNNEKIYYALNT
jgi:predicted dehydrogenase